MKNNAYLVIIAIIVLMYIGACASSKNRNTTQMQDTTFAEDKIYLGETIYREKTGDTVYGLHSHRPLIERYWEASRNKSIEEKKEILYEEYINKIGKEFFTKYSYYELTQGGDFDAAFDASIDESLEYLEAEGNYEQIIAFTKYMEENSKEIVKEVIDFYGGMGEELYFVLTFFANNTANARLLNLDMRTPLFLVSSPLLYENNINQDIHITLREILTHELTHNYHMSRNGELARTILTDSEKFYNEAKYYWMMYLEGVATYGAAKINNADEEVFKNISDEDTRMLAREFLPINDIKIFIEDEGKHFPRWFNESDEPIGGRQFPGLIGYFLGSRVVKDIVERKGIPFDTFVEYNILDPELLEEIKTSLEYLAFNT